MHPIVVVDGFWDDFHVILAVCLLLLPLVDYGLSCLDGGNSLEDVRYFLFGSGYERENVGDIVLLPSGVVALPSS